MNLDPRLSACAELVDKNSVVCDIGTDHGYLPVFLVQQGKSKKAVAGDIGKAPLESAKKHIKKYNLSDKIQTVLSDGLKDIEKNDITHIVIAGMGGETIIDILSSCNWARDCILVLQPMTKPEMLRMWLYENGYKINLEKAVSHEKFIYTVMKCSFSGNVKNINLFEAFTGGLDLKDENSKKYILKKAKSLKKSARGKLNSPLLVDKAKEDLKLSEELLDAIK
ncbi:MAG: SAM-dependent methyltransferase [Clostridiales bacterium]|nr:SAM-dependent methyltransferase [Clostridiales bacterium]